MAENTQLNKNLFKKFRGTKEDVMNLSGMETFTKRFDEPTYFSFRLMFGSNSDNHYNIANDQALYDTMPHPLFNAFEKATTVDFRSGTRLPFTGTPVSVADTYSAMHYLINSNEPTRAEMLREFIQKFNTLQSQFPYYFQSVDGVADLLKIDPTKGQREPNETKITITCLEGLDLRMSYLLNLYRKIVWDDTYQRWVLPDMMRYFTLQIYLAEFRTFHLPRIGGSGPEAEVGKNPMYLDILDSILPTWKITCEMCEFDITDITYDHLGSLSVATDPVQGAVKFGIKVGNIKEMQIYPTFKHMYLIDRKLNGLNRAKEEISTSDEDNTASLYPASLQIAQGRDHGILGSEHVSGLPFNERSNTINVDEAALADNLVNGSLPVNFNPTDPATWVGNALDFGTSYAKNFVNKLVDKGKITPIPGLGVSFSEVQSAIQGKNVIGALGLIRKGINEVVKSYGNAPSERLEGPIQTDEIMRAFLSEISRLPDSEATDDDTNLLREIVTAAIKNGNAWQVTKRKIKDYSLATDLVGDGERNINKSLEGTKQYQELVEKQSIVETPLIPNDGIPRVEPNAASGKITADKIDMVAASSQLNRDVDEKVDQPGPSERLASSTEGDALLRNSASERLGNSTESASVERGSASEKLEGNVTDGVSQGKPSSNLSSTVEGSGMKTADVNKNDSKLESTGEMKDNSPNVKTRTIDVNKIIEYDPTSIMYRKVEGEQLKQPNPSKATNSKLE